MLDIGTDAHARNILKDFADLYFILSRWKNKQYLTVEGKTFELLEQTIDFAAALAAGEKIFTFSNRGGVLLVWGGVILRNPPSEGSNCWKQVFEGGV